MMTKQDYKIVADVLNGYYFYAMDNQSEEIVETINDIILEMAAEFELHYSNFDYDKFMIATKGDK